jgi:ferrous iron transport protein B
MGRLKQYLQPYWLYMIFTMVIKLAGAVTELMIPDLMETIIDEKVPLKDQRSVFLYGGAMLLQWGITPKMALCAAIFTVFHWPCGTTVLTVWKETGKWRYAFGAMALPTAVGVVLCLLFRLLPWFG